MANVSFATFLSTYALIIFCLELGNYFTAADKCDEENFYLPYAEVRKKKNAGNIASIRRSGFLDLRFRNRVTLCINGPAVLYSDVERLDPEARLSPEKESSRTSLKSAPDARYPSPDPSGASEAEDTSNFEELRFKKGELLVFSHQCISINKVPMNVLKKMKEDQGRPQPELMSDTQTMGRLVLGVYLIGNKEGYNFPELAWFKGTNWDYIKTSDKVVKDSSFIISGQNAAHCIRLPDGTHVKISSVPTTGNNTQVCKWTVREEDKPWYARVFQRGFDGNGIRNDEPTLNVGDYEIYECSDADNDRSIILTMSRSTPEPVVHVNYTEFDPFSLFNPNHWTPHGFRRDSGGLSGGDERPDDKMLNIGMVPENGIPCSLDPSNPGCEDLEATTLKDMQNVDQSDSNSFEIVAGECMDLVEFDVKECNGVGENGQRILELVLELEPQYLVDKTQAGSDGAAAAPPPAEGGGAGGGVEPILPLVNASEEAKVNYPHYGNLDDDSELKWKFDILYLASDIYRHLCMPFRPEMPYTVARVFGWYLYKAHVYGEEMGRSTPPIVVDTKGGEGGAPPAGAPPPPGAPGEPAPPPPPPPSSDQYDYLIEKTGTWVILNKELERCKATARGENGGKGIKFMWEVGDEAGRWKISAVDGRQTRRKRKKRSSVKRSPVRRPIMPEYAPKIKRSGNSKEFWEKAAESKRMLSRRKRTAGGMRPNTTIFYNKYVLPGKTLTPIRSEGTTGFVREVIQEYRPKPDLNDPRADAIKYLDYPENIHHCWNPQEDPISREIVCSKTEEIFFYEDRAEIDYELNIAIDIWWKIWATVIGYCNKAYTARKSETFPRLYNAMYEHFFDLVKKEWKFPQDNAELKIIFSEYLTEESHIWMDACLEASYINSNSHSFRPPRPMTVTEGKKEVSNYFEEVPPFIYYRYHPEPNEHGMGK